MSKSDDAIAKLEAEWVSASALQTLTGWNGNTVRGFLSRLRKARAVQTRKESGTREYHINGAA